MAIDITKYKRVFTFGCSFTLYCCPTWADLLFLEMPDAEHYNFGQGGSGNTLISNRIVQANLKYKLCETDLVIVLYTSPLREDRWINGSWHPHGNIFNQRYYDKSFVKNYCDPVGLMLKDASTVELSRHYVDNLPCDTVQLLAANIHRDLMFDLTVKEKEVLDRVLALFATTYDSFPKRRIPKDTRGFNIREENGSVRWDSHPNPNEHLAFMKAVGLPTGPASEEYAAKATEFVLAEPRSHDELAEQFPEIDERTITRDIELI